MPDLSVTPQRMKLVAAYVDVEGEYVKVVPPPSNVTQVRFTLSETSAFTGVAGNWPASGGSTAPDFHLAAGQQAMTLAFGGDHTARIDFVVSDYGGRTKITVSAVGENDQHEIRVPKDEDNNMLPDADWIDSNGEEVSSVGRAKDNDADFDPVTSAPPSTANPANGMVGDGLSVYEEYRGFMTRGMHIRTHPEHKDLFMSSNLSWGLAYASPNLPLRVHRVWGQDEIQPTEYDSDRVINFNDTNSGAGGAIPGHSEQKALRAKAATTEIPGLFGEAKTETNTNATPNRTTVIEMYPATAETPAIPPSERLNLLRKIFTHEVGHALHICHRGPTSSPASTSPCTPAETGPGPSAMTTQLFLGSNGQADPPTQYNDADRGQIRLHTNPPQGGSQP